MPKVTQPKRGETTAAWLRRVRAFLLSARPPTPAPRQQGEARPNTVLPTLLCLASLGRSQDPLQQGAPQKALHVVLKLRRPLTVRTGRHCGLCRLLLGCPLVRRKGLQVWPGWTRKRLWDPTGSEFAGHGRGPPLSLPHWLPRGRGLSLTLPPMKAP